MAAAASRALDPCRWAWDNLPIHAQDRDRANSSAYGHAARYLKRLREIAACGEPLDPLMSHAAFEQHLQAVHPRKVSFWNEVAGVAGARSMDALLDP